MAAVPAPIGIGRQYSVGSVCEEGPLVLGLMLTGFLTQVLCSARKYCSSPLCPGSVLGLFWASAPSVPRHRAIPLKSYPFFM